MDDNDVDIDDKSGNDVDDDVDDEFDDDEDVNDDYPKYGEDTVGLVDRPFGGLAPTGWTRPMRVRLMAQVTERKHPFEKEASSAQGVRDADAQARNRSVSGGGGTDKEPQGKTGQGVSSADFFVNNKRQSKKEADRAHGDAVAAATQQGAGRAQGVKMAAGAIQRAKDLKDRARRSPTKAIREGAPADDGRTDPSDRSPNRGIAGADDGS
jgi:hypothetical protein